MTPRRKSRARPPFQRLQLRFAAHLRDPKRFSAPPGIEARRMKIYTELFFNNVEGFLSSAFPVLRRITPEARWRALARDFFARHRSHQPLFRGIAEEFLKYLDRERKVQGDPPFLRELAHYEWVELALSVAPAPHGAEHADPRGDVMEGVPVVSTLAWVLAYEFPVHRIAPDFQPRVPGAQPTHLVVYRNRQDEVKFMEINAVTARLLQLMAARRATGRQLLARIAREMKHPQPEQVVADGAAILRGLRDRDIILGGRRHAGGSRHPAS